MPARVAGPPSACAVLHFASAGRERRCRSRASREAHAGTRSARCAANGLLASPPPRPAFARGPQRPAAAGDAHRSARRARDRGRRGARGPLSAMRKSLASGPEVLQNAAVVSDLRSTSIWFRPAMALAVAAVFLLAYLDLRREQARALDDFSSEQATLARASAAAVEARIAGVLRELDLARVAAG